MRKFLLTGTVIVTMFLFYSCGGSDVEISDISGIPNATAPVIGNSLASQSVKVNAANTGLVLASANSGSFNSSSSRAMCEVVNSTKEALARASSSDQVLCYVKNVMVAAANQSALSTSGINIYDGNYHVFTLDFTGNPYVTNDAPKIKMRIVKDGNAITNFEMFMCFAGSAASPQQSEYLNQVFNDENVTITSKNIQTESGGSYKSDFTVLGTLNSSYQFTQKTINALNYWDQSYGGYDNEGAMQAEFTQYSDAMAVSAYNSGTWQYGSDSGTHVEQIYSMFEILAADSLLTIAVGDGSLKLTQSGTGSHGSYSHSDTLAWTGDNTLPVSPASGGLHYSSVSATSVPATDPTSSAQAIAFTGTEVWDCSGASEATLAVDQTALDVTCAAYGFNHDSWIDCYDIMGQD